MIVGTVARAPVSEVSEVRTRSSGRRLRIRIGRGLYWVAFPELIELGSLRSRIRHFPNGTPPELLLDAEIPVLHVRIVKVGVQREQRWGIRIRQRVQREPLRKVVQLRVRF